MLRTTTMLLPLVLLALVLQPTSAASFSSAADARSKMEQIVSKYAGDMESMYADMTSGEGANCAGKYVPSCDPQNQYSNKWAAATQSSNPKRFNNPTTETCTRFDKNAANQFMTTVFTGREGTCSTTPSLCRDPTTASGASLDCSEPFNVNNPKCQCEYPIIKKPNFQLHANTISKSDYLISKGCITASNTAKCTVNEDEYGINYPGDTGTGGSISDDRMCAEIVASTSLVSQFKANAAAYDDLQWTFSGMQETGLYRNWPLIYQCRTENQCSGCSDPRFRNWYAEAASGPKDVVMILDTSGSMSKKGRFALMQKAAKWVVNTLTKYDTATVIDFSSQARAMDWGSGNTNLQKMDDVGRAKMRDYIDNLSVIGQTNMPAAFTKAFDVLDATHAAGGGSGCGLAQTVILFLTDGENSADSSPVEVVKARNTADFSARVFTYSLGSDSRGSDAMMGQLACDTAGVHSKVDDGGNLEKVMAQYFMYLSAGIAHSSATVRWSDWFEDGQGLGQIIGACAPVYDRAASAETGVSIMFGVICVSIHKDTWEGYSDHAAVMNAIKTADAVCPAKSLSETQMEVVRGRFEGSRTCQSVADEAEKKRNIAIGAGVGGVLAVMLFVACIYCHCCKKKKKDEAPKPAPQQPPTAYIIQVPQPVPAQAPQPAPAVAVVPAQRLEVALESAAPAPSAPPPSYEQSVGTAPPPSAPAAPPSYDQGLTTELAAGIQAHKRQKS